MVSTRPLISKSSSPCTNHLITVPSAPVTTGITVTYMLHSFFFSSLPRSRWLSLSFHSVLPCSQPEWQIRPFSRFLFLLTIASSGGLAEIKGSVCIPKPQSIMCAFWSRLKCHYSCFSYHFCLVVFFVGVSWYFFYLCCFWWLQSISLRAFLVVFFFFFVVVSMVSWTLASFLPPFLNTCCLFASFLGCEALCFAMSFHVLWFVCGSS